jgi:MFS family permease
VLETKIQGEQIPEWKQGWRVVVAAVTGMMLTSVHIYSTGVMIVPLENEFGWSRAQISTGMLICSVFSVLFSPFFGMLIDRFGPRRIALFGVSFYCLALASLSLASAAIWTWFLLWTLLAIALLNTKPTVWIAAISSLFDRNRGLALALLLCSTGLSQTFTPVIAHSLVEQFGWRLAYAFLGLGVALISLPILWFWFSSALDRQRLSGVAGVTATPDLPGLSAKEGFHSATFWRLAIAALAMSAAGGTLTVNLVPILAGSGIDMQDAVWLAGVSGASAICGRLLGGYLIDRMNARLVGGIAVLLPIATCIILILAPGNIPLVIFGIFLSGLAAGAEMDAIAYMASRSFGLRRFGLLFGTLSGVLALGVGLGPTLANLTYDLTRSYEYVLWAIIPLSLLTSVMFLTVAPYPDFEAKSE